MIQPEDLSRWAQGLIKWANTVQDDAYTGDNVAILVGYAQSARTFVIGENQ